MKLRDALLNLGVAEEDIRSRVAYRKPYLAHYGGNNTFPARVLVNKYSTRGWRITARVVGNAICRVRYSSGRLSVQLPHHIAYEEWVTCDTAADFAAALSPFKRDRTYHVVMAAATGYARKSKRKLAPSLQPQAAA
ncbi:MAG: hypothetical protein WAX89_07380 [Alphaproteobacteria bacterium]